MLLLYVDDVRSLVCLMHSRRQRQSGILKMCKSSLNADCLSFWSKTIY